MKVELIKVGNGTNAIDYDGVFVKKENELIAANIQGYSLHLFCGSSPLGDVRVDSSTCPEIQDNITIHDDVFSYLAMMILKHLKRLFLILPIMRNLLRNIGRKEEQRINS